PLPLTFFFFADPAPPVIYTLSLHDALPISRAAADGHEQRIVVGAELLAGLVLEARERLGHLVAEPLGLGAIGPHVLDARLGGRGDRKSTRLNSSHVAISYAVFCLKKKQSSR